MSGFETTIQKVVYDKLNAGLSYSVFDDVPYLPVGAPETDFPYVVIGDDTAIAFDTDDQVGMESTVTIHVWSRSGGRKQCKDILSEIYVLLNRASLTTTGYNYIDCLFEFSETFTEDDGITRHGVARYRITLQEV